MKIALEDAASTLVSMPAGSTFITLLEHGTMHVEYYQPKGVDLQTPHRQDEIYIIAAGSGSFIKAGDVYTFKAGDLFFVPAGIEHRFQNFTHDFATWVILYGADGGEAGMTAV